MDGSKKSFFKHTLLFTVLLLSIALLGCTNTDLVLPYTTQQLIARSTDLNYTLFVDGYYDGNCLLVDNNVVSVGSCGDVNGSTDWADLTGFPVGCSGGQAVQVIGSSLACVDLTVDTNFETAGYGTNSLIDWTNASEDFDTTGNVEATNVTAVMYGSEDGTSLMSYWGPTSEVYFWQNVDLQANDLETTGDIKQGDNAKHYFGAGDDVSTEFDGTDWKFNTGSNKMLIESSSYVSPMMELRGERPSTVYTITDDSGGIAMNIFDIGIDNINGTQDWVRLGVLGNATPAFNYFYIGDAYNDNALRIYPDKTIKLSNDNQKLYFGAGDDAYMQWTGTNMEVYASSGNYVYNNADAEFKQNILVRGDAKFYAGGGVMEIESDSSGNNIRLQSYGGQPLYINELGNDVIFSDDLYLRADNQKLYFGAGDDASITYDGTNMVITPDEVGSGVLKVEGDLNIGTSIVLREDNNITMTSPDGTKWNCGVNNSGVFSCS